MCWEPTKKTWGFVWTSWKQLLEYVNFLHDYTVMVIFQRKTKKMYYCTTVYICIIYDFSRSSTLSSHEPNLWEENFNPIIQSLRFPHRFLAGRKTQGFAWGADCLQDPRSTTTGSLRMLRLRRFKCLEHVAHRGVYGDAWSLVMVCTKGYGVERVEGGVQLRKSFRPLQKLVGS